MTELMGPGKALRRLTLRYVDFDGRSGRSAYWWAMLVLAIITGGFTLWLRTRGAALTVTAIFAADVIFLAMFFTAAILAVPYASLHVRRYRDAGLNPWLLLLTVFLPLIMIVAETGVQWVNISAAALLVVNLILCTLPSKPNYSFF
ncbi:DUF805 domain-containing protein [Lacticaseibacillus zhaodongensis]|uniref:DUF805 domain-containing protein n=1 Tax=Lacticaseibacillus zhaodongensis TaxID=2668065 RepID=UPI0012D2B125|nr:DUF805 domain-containing protein [Lacticaseibacillus zhaodongensis]